jgi:hypothetical protein
MFMHWLKKLSIVTAAAFVFSGYAQATNVTLSYGETPVLAVVKRDAGVSEPSEPFNFTDIYDLYIDPDLTFTLPFTFKATAYDELGYMLTPNTLSFGLYNSSDNLLTGPYLLSPGESYQLRVSGTAEGILGGKYFLSTNVSTPVPEPDLGLVMLAGLGMIGVVTLRKSKA